MARVLLAFDSTALNVSSEVRPFRNNHGDNSNYFKTGRPRPYCDYCKRVGHVKAKCYRLIGHGDSSNYFKAGRLRPCCDYCKRVGHVNSKCYRLVGYPSQDKGKNNFTYHGQQSGGGYQQQSNAYGRQGNKGKGTIAVVYNNSDDSLSIKGEGSTHEGPKEQAVSLTKQQYDQLMRMMQHFNDHNANPNAVAVNSTGPFNEEASGD